MESTRGPNKLQTLANIASIIVSVLLSVVLVKVFLLPQKGPAPNLTQPHAGMNMKQSLPGIDWARNNRTLVLALSTQCHFCNESAPFFRRVADEAGKDLRMVAVLPQSTAEAQTYLTNQGVRVDEVRQAPTNSIGVTGTPTLLLVNSAGVVTHVWVGKLQPDQEAEALSILKSAKLGG